MEAVLDRKIKEVLFAGSGRQYMAACICTIIAVSAPLGGYAEIFDEQPGKRFTLDGTRLIFDGSVARANGDDEIDHPDARELRTFLFEHPEIEVLELNAKGGIVTAALDMAAVLVDYKIDTIVTGRCISACTLVFLAGANRTLEKGARLGFHSARWSRQDIKEYYEKARESRGWVDEFAFASWVYEESSRDFNKHLEFMTSRGVDVQFVIREAYVNNDDIWYPSREELLRYRILLQD